MSWWCDGCGRRRRGPCKKVCVEAVDTYVINGVTMSMQRGNASATQVPPLDGMVFLNDDGSGITHYDQAVWDNTACRRDKHPKVTQGPRPSGWAEAMEVIGERAAKEMHGGLPEC